MSACRACGRIAIKKGSEYDRTPESDLTNIEYLPAPACQGSSICVGYFFALLLIIMYMAAGNQL
jgi:hypothetical protein